MIENIKYTRVTSQTKHPLFAEAWRLYKYSFPPQERRQLRTQKKIMDHPQYHFELITDDESFVGFILWWEFCNVRYIEHLAICSHLRSRGYGLPILKQFVSASEIPVILEVEHPTNEINGRRIGFYQRAGFILNKHPYAHPPYKRGGHDVSLLLMTYPAAITENNLNRFIRECHPVIFPYSFFPQERCLLV